MPTALTPSAKAWTWKMLELVVSRTVPGTLADVLYGMDTHDSVDMMLRTACVDDS